MQRIIVAIIVGLCFQSVIAGEIEGRSSATAPRASSQITASMAGLTPTEIQRYEHELGGMISFANENISPLEVLGISADSVAEKRRYAELYVEKRLAHTRASLEWAVFVEEAAERINARAYLEESVVIRATLAQEATRLKGEQRRWFGLDKQHGKATPFQTALVAARKVLFIKPNCRSCDAEFASLYGQVVAGEVPAVDVVFADMGAEHRREITRWAATVGIDPALTRARKITLNFEGARWRALRGGRTVPYVTSTTAP